MVSGRGQLLCVVSPCYNEAEVLRAFYDGLKAELLKIGGLRHRILFVDDGSQDGTLEQLNQIAAADPAVAVYSLSRNFGHQVALTAGLDAARGDAVVMMDADLQHPPSLIPDMVARWEQGADVVSAVRRTTANQTRFKRLTSRGFYKVLNLLSDTPIPEGAADFCLLSRRAHKALRDMPERHRFLRGMVSWIGFERVFVKYDAPARAAGRSKYTLRRMFRLASTAVFSFSAAPLRTASRVGLATIAAGFAYLAYIFVRYALYHDLVPGWSSVVCSIVILGGLQLFFIGLIGEYLARIFEEVKGRPLYLFKQKPPRRRTLAGPGTGSAGGGLTVTFGPGVRRAERVPADELGTRARDIDGPRAEAILADGAPCSDDHAPASRPRLRGAGANPDRFTYADASGDEARNEGTDRGTNE